MFQKPFKVKSNNIVKKSEKKKIHDELRQYNPKLSIETLQDLLPLKEDVSVIKLCTYSQDIVTVYSHKKNPTFFVVNKLVLPTVYAMWKHPDLVISFETHASVNSKLKGGADLMLPGVIVPKNGFKPFTNGQPCSVRVTGSKASVAVGKTALDSYSIERENVRTGKLVNIMHTFEDHLWELGDKSSPPVINNNEGDDDELTNDDKSDNVKLGASNILQSVSTRLSDERKDVRDDNKRENIYKDVGDVVSGGKNAHSDFASMDDLLKQCFLSAIILYGKKIQLPILYSTFYGRYVMKCCPDDKCLDVKKTTYKKASTFLSYMQEEELIIVEETNRGVESIMSIDFDHDMLRTFEIPSWANERKEIGSSSSADQYDIEYTPPEITTVYRVTTPLLFQKGDSLSMADLRGHITKYVRDNQLNEGRNVQLDEKLSAVALNKNEYAPVLSWAELIDRIVDKMTVCHKVVFPNQEPSIRTGYPKKIIFNVSKKGSNKKITVVKNLELYGLDVENLVSVIQKMISCSVKLQPSDDKDSSGNRNLQVQGNQIHIIRNLLIGQYCC
ncbi:hypothetical protein HELRODRAFT_113630 [Helobdella robusta]|uniref:SUI1 domain-containing protein n=1 Tax=Helobdella robusta TaxID=6412 RepID=T1EFU4_HELRO|nr:hypothetical protein HELRODRAFT_113630 [Helobdella robusta]ESN99503.1 hypothetical protein HELRODRAFT_113630 [Helobdella robusta]